MEHFLLYIIVILAIWSPSLGLKSGQKRMFYDLINNHDVAKMRKVGLQRHLDNFLEKKYLKRSGPDVPTEIDETADVEKRVSHKHGFIFFFLDTDHDYKLSMQELSRLLDCSVFGDNKNATLIMFMNRDMDGDGLDVHEWEDIASLSRHGLAMELYRYKYN